MPRIPKLLTHSKGSFFVRVTGPDGKRRDHNFGRDPKKPRSSIISLLLNCAKIGITRSPQGL